MISQKNVEKLQNLVFQKINKKIRLYAHFSKKVQQILGESKQYLRQNNPRGFIILQGLRLKFKKQQTYRKILQSYTKPRRQKFLKQLEQIYISKKQNINQMIDIASLVANSIKSQPIGVNNLFNKTWTPKNENMKPIYEKLNYFNKKFKEHIQGVFMSNNFIFDWNRTKDIIRKAVHETGKTKQQTTAQNIMNQIYSKMEQQGQFDSPTQRMNKIKDATMAYSEQILHLSTKVRQMNNDQSKTEPGKKILTNEQMQEVNQNLQFVKQNLKKITARYEQLMVLTSGSTKGKFYINLMLLFLGQRKLPQIQQIIDQVQDYNRATQGYGFQKLAKQAINSSGNKSGGGNKAASKGPQTIANPSQKFNPTPIK